MKQITSYYPQKAVVKPKDNQIPVCLVKKYQEDAFF